MTTKTNQPKSSSKNSSKSPSKTEQIKKITNKNPTKTIKKNNAISAPQKPSKKPLKTYSMDELSDKALGKKGTAERDQAEKWFENEIEQELKTRELFGSLIKMARKGEGISQEELASRLGVKKSMISKLENSQTNTKIDTIVNVLKIMNLKLLVRVAHVKENLADRKRTESKKTYEFV